MKLHAITATAILLIGGTVGSAADPPFPKTSLDIAAIVDWAGPEKDTVQYSEDGVDSYVVASMPYLEKNDGENDAAKSHPNPCEW